LVQEQRNLHRQRRLYADLLDCYATSAPPDVVAVSTDVAERPEVAGTVAAAILTSEPEVTATVASAVETKVTPLPDVAASRTVVAASQPAQMNGAKPAATKRRGTELIGPRVRRQVREILTDAGGELSINDIHAEFLRRGYDVPGQGRPANITIHLSGSEEITSPARGLYRLKPAMVAHVEAPAPTPRSSEVAVAASDEEAHHRPSVGAAPSKNAKKKQHRSQHGAKATSKKKARKKKRRNKQSR